MISIDKIVQQLQQCKDTSIILPIYNDSIFVQKTSVEIRKSELELLKNNFKTKPSVRKELIQHTPVVCFHTTITVFA